MVATMVCWTGLEQWEDLYENIINWCTTNIHPKIDGHKTVNGQWSQRCQPRSSNWWKIQIKYQKDLVPYGHIIHQQLKKGYILIKSYMGS